MSKESDVPESPQKKMHQPHGICVGPLTYRTVQA